MNFNYLAVFVAVSTLNLGTLVDFYRELFQVEPSSYQIDIYAEFVLGTLRLGMFQPKGDHQSEFKNIASSMSLCLEVKDLDQAIATLIKLGYPPTGEVIDASHGKEIYAYDPDGNRLILHQGNLTTDCKWITSKLNTSSQADC